MFFRFSAGLPAASLVLPFALGGPALGESLLHLLRPVEEQRPAAAQPAFRLITDRTSVHVDLGLIDPGRASDSDVIQAEFGGLSLVLLKRSVESRGKQDYTWTGTVQDYELSTVVLTVVKGVLYGHLDFGGKSYSIEPAANEYVVTGSDAQQAVAPFDRAVAPESSRAKDAAVSRDQAQEDGSRIDVMVLFTRRLQDRYTTQLEAMIQHFIDISNTAYANSGVNTRLRLVYSGLFDSSGVAEGVHSCDALDTLTDNAVAADLRRLYNADLVSLLRVFTGDNCGCGWVMGPGSVSQAFAANAFSVVEVRPLSEADPYYCHETTLAHELGHNMGCAHDRDHASVLGAYSYSYGYDVRGVFGTIMSYDGPTITYFSTPLVTYQGYPIGRDAAFPDSADNARTLNNTRTVVANFKNLANLIPPVISGVSVTGVGYTSATISWVTDKGATSQVEYGFSDSYGYTSYFDASLVITHQMLLESLRAGSTYHFRVRSQDSSGALAVSGDYVFTTPADVTPPTVSLTSPRDGATVSGTVVLTAEAADNAGVAGVQFKLNGADLGGELTQAPYTLNWDTTRYADGGYNVWAVARDIGFNTSLSSIAAVTVSSTVRRIFTPNQDGVDDLFQIEFSVFVPQRVSVVIRDRAGKVIRTLLEGVLYQPGSHSVIWDGLTDAGETAYDGFYSYSVSGELSPPKEEIFGLNNTIPQVSRSWFLAEGSTVGFEAFVLIQNPNDTPITANVTFFKQDGTTKVYREAVSPKTRTTVPIHREVPNTYSVSTGVEAEQPIIVERAMYFNAGKAGHNSVGAVQTSRRWYFPGNRTFAGDEDFVLVVNPNPAPAVVTARLFLEDQPPLVQTHNLFANSRFTLPVHGYVQGRRVSVSLESTQPVVAERAFYSNGRQGGCSGIGAVSPSYTWYFAAVNSPGATIELLNPGNDAAHVRLNYMLGPPYGVNPTDHELGPQRRMTIDAYADLHSSTVAPVEVLSDRPIVAECMSSSGSEWSDTIGSPTPALAWNLAEGFTAYGFTTVVYIGNPGNQDANVIVRYMQQNGVNVIENHQVRAKGLVTLIVNNSVDPLSVSTQVTSDRPIVVERTVHFGDGSGVHRAMGVRQ